MVSMKSNYYLFGSLGNEKLRLFLGSEISENFVSSFTLNSFNFLLYFSSGALRLAVIFFLSLIILVHYSNLFIISSKKRNWKRSLCYQFQHIWFLFVILSKNYMENFEKKKQLFLNRKLKRIPFASSFPFLFLFGFPTNKRKKIFENKRI